eukprot:g10288.t1
MLGRLLARAAAATHRQAAQTLRRPRVTPASLRGGSHAPDAGGSASCGAAGLQRKLTTAVDAVDDGSSSSGAVDPEVQQWQGQFHKPREPARWVGGDRAPRNDDRSRNSGGRHSSGRGGGRGGRKGRGGRAWGERGGGFARGRADESRATSCPWAYSETIKELRRTGKWIQIIEMFKQACDDPDVTVDHVMFNSTIAALARSPKWKVALSVLQELRDNHTVAPDIYTFNAALMACAHGRQGQLAFALLGEMRAAGVAPNSFTFAHLVAVCSREGKWEAALSLVDEMKQAGLRPSCVTYNSVIVALGNGGEPDRAVGVLDTMREEGVQVTEGSYSAAIAASGKAGGWERALRLLEEMKDGRDNLQPNEFCYNSAISACKRSAKWQEALTLLRDMQEAQLTVTAGTYSHVIKACTNAGQIEEARALLDEMSANGLKVRKSLAAMVRGRSERRSSAQRPWDQLPPETPAGEASRAARAHADNAAAPRASFAPEDGVFTPTLARPPQDATASSWIDALPMGTAACPPSNTPPASADQPLRRAEDEPASPAYTPNSPAAQQQTDSDGVTSAALDARADTDAHAYVSPSTATVPPLPSTAASAAARLSGGSAEMLATRPPRSRAVKDFIRGAGSHSRNGRWSEILSDLDKAMADPNTKVSMRMYESCLVGLASGGKWVEALAVLERMQGAGLKPNAPCLTAAIKACAKANPPKWGLALSLLQGLDEPWVWAYAAALKALARAGQWKACAALLDQMREDGVEPNVFCYNGVLEACRRAEPPQWQHACSVLSQMKAAGVPPNEVCYKTAILVCQAASEVGEAKALLSEMVEAGFPPQEELRAGRGGVVVECASP